MNPLPTSPIITNTNTNNNPNIIPAPNNNNNNNNNPQSPNPQQFNQQFALNLFDPTGQQQQLLNAAAAQQQAQQQQQQQQMNNVSIPSPMNTSLHQQLANQVVSPTNSVHSSSSIPSGAIPTNPVQVPQFQNLPNPMGGNGVQLQPQSLLMNAPFINTMYQQQAPPQNPMSPQNQPINGMNGINNNDANMRNVNINGNLNMNNMNNNNGNVNNYGNNEQHPLSPHGNNQQAAVLQEFAIPKNNGNGNLNVNNNGNNNRNNSNGNKNNHNRNNNGRNDMDNNIIHSPNSSSSNHHSKYPDFDYKALTQRLRDQYATKREEWDQLPQNDALFETLDRPLVEALLLPKHRPQILAYEQKINDFLLKDEWRYRFPANLSSFNRLLLHRLSESYKLEHHVEFVDNGNNNRNQMDNKHHRNRDDQNL